MITVSTLLVSMPVTTAVTGSLSGSDVQPVGAEHDDVGLFAGSEGAHLVVEAVGLGTLDGGPPQHLTGRDRGFPSRPAIDRCRPSTDRIWLNMSAGTLVSTSTLRLGRQAPVEELLDRRHPVAHHHLHRGGQETVPPVSTIIWISVSLRVVQWM
jgi:hypothetical protein